MTCRSSFATALVVILAGGSSNAVAASILAAATRTDAFVSISKAEIPIPLKNNGVTELLFMTSVNNQSVKITYNAECVVTGTRGKWLSVRILVDNVEADPASGHDFALCTAVDKTGSTWIGATRQSVFKIPAAGMHTVKVMGRLNVGLLGGGGTWRLDDSSLVVETSITAFATRTGGHQSTSAPPQGADLLPLKENGGKMLAFDTARSNELLRFSYNAECVLAAPAPGKLVMLYFNLDGIPLNSMLGSPLCGSVDTTGKTWVGAISQYATKVATAGSHVLKLYGVLNTGTGTWTLDDTSLVVDSAILASAARSKVFDSTSTVEVTVPLKNNGADTLQFTTTSNNQLAVINFSALCHIAGPRGRWLSVRIAVDGQNADPASGGDFALCSSIAPGLAHDTVGFRQSTFTVPAAGSHTVQVFAKASAMASWALNRTLLTVR
jgi:hypothetical protein